MTTDDRRHETRGRLVVAARIDAQPEEHVDGQHRLPSRNGATWQTLEDEGRASLAAARQLMFCTRSVTLSDVNIT